MNNIKFYIYGVPDGFNMLSGTHDEILYYQLFYNTSKKGTEMRINRKANGETIYSYLKYNLVSCKGREGSFLGMSVVFNDYEYCDNPERLKELFEAVYNSVILKADDSDKIVAKIDGGNAVGRFCISKFAERQALCEKIGRIVIQNVVGELKGHIKRWNESGENIKVGCIIELPFNSDNTKIIQALRSYSWVSVSTGYTPPTPGGSTPDPEKEKLAVHYINELTRKVTVYKDFIIQGLKGQVSPAEISAKREEVNSTLNTIEKYTGNQPELLPLREQYMAVYKEIVNLPSTRIDPGPSPKPKPKPRHGHKGHHLPLKQIAMGSCAVAVIACLALLWPKEEPQPLSSTDTEVKKTGLADTPPEFDMSRFNALLEKADYNAALNMVNQEKTDTAKLQGMIRRSYEKWFNEEFEKAKNNKSALNSLRIKVDEYSNFGQNKDTDKQRIKKHIDELQQKSDGDNGSTGDSSNPTITVTEVKIYKADVDYKYKEEDLIEGNTINANKGDQFVIIGAELPRHTSQLEFDKKNDRITVRATGIGRSRVTINNTTYTFNITMPQ